MTDASAAHHSATSVSSRDKTHERPPRVGLFVTCLVDTFRPSIGFAAVTLLEAAGCEVVVPEGQTCCGQPAWNSGDRKLTAKLLEQTISAFADCDYVVAPSGSCIASLKKATADLILNAADKSPASDSPERERADDFVGKCHEIVSFLVRERGMTTPPGAYRGRVTYHDSCSGLRELSIKSEPRTLLAAMDGVELVEMADSEICCGFGGTFSVKFPDVSHAMVDKKIANAAASQAELLLAGDLGCLMNMAGRLRRLGRPVACRHVCEVLAGDLTAPPVADR